MTGVEVRVEGLSKCNDDPEAVLAEAAGTAQPPRRLRGAEQVCEDAAAGEQNREQYAEAGSGVAGAQQLAAAGRLTVTAQRVDGTWKIAAVDPR